MILWLEDRRGTVLMHEKKMRDLEITYKMLSNPQAVKLFLEEAEAEGGVEDTQIVFLIDLMLHGVSDLRMIGIDNAPTLSGNHAGYVFADRFLRGSDSKWKNCPICFLTERDLDDGLLRDVNLLRDHGKGEVAIFSKYSDKSLGEMIEVLSRWVGEF